MTNYTEPGGYDPAYRAVPPAMGDTGRADDAVVSDPNDPDAIRRDIERTRAELGSDVDALADKVSPNKIAERQVDKAKNAFENVKERVMGTVHDVKDSGSGATSSLKDRASSATGAVGNASGRAVETAKGNPFAMGLIAFGAGWLVASLLPASGAERGLASQAKDAAQPLVHKAQEAAKDVASNLQEPAQEAFQSVKETATDAAQTVKSEGQDAAQGVKDSAQGARENVQNS